MSRARPALGLAAALVACLCSCGVPLTDQAQSVPGYQPPTSPTSAQPSDSAGAMEALWYVEGDRLRRLETAASGTASAARAVALLASPPQQPGLRTLVGDPQGGTPLATVVDDASPGSVGPTPVIIRLSDTFSKLAPTDQVLLIGQVVLTVTETSPASVEFVDVNNAPVTVPLPDGRLQDAPVGRADYLVLAKPTPSPSATR